MDPNDLERLSAVVAMALMRRVGTDSVTFTDEELEAVQDKPVGDAKNMKVLLFDNVSVEGKVTVKVLTMKDAEGYQAKMEEKRRNDELKNT